MLIPHKKIQRTYKFRIYRTKMTKLPLPTDVMYGGRMHFNSATIAAKKGENFAFFKDAQRLYNH